MKAKVKGKKDGKDQWWKSQAAIKLKKFLVC